MTPQNIEEKMFIEAEVQLGTKKLRKLIKDIRTQTLKEVLDMIKRMYKIGTKVPDIRDYKEWDNHNKGIGYNSALSDFKQIIIKMMGK